MESFLEWSKLVLGIGGFAFLAQAVWISGKINEAMLDTDPTLKNKHDLKYGIRSSDEILNAIALKHKKRAIFYYKLSGIALIFVFSHSLFR